MKKLDFTGKVIFGLAVFTIVFCGIILITDKSSAEEYHILPIDPFVCRTYWTEPVKTVCENKAMICVHYGETDQEECFLKPVKW